MNRIINVPKRGIGAATVDKLLAFADENHYGLDAWIMWQKVQLIPELLKS